MSDKTIKRFNAQGARSAGVLLHISSLPGKYGIGTFGRSAYAFVDFLKEAGVRYWQVLPLVQTGFGDSPYQSVCCHSGNPYFIDPDILHERGLLTKNDLLRATMPAGNIDFARLYAVRYAMLRKAFSRFNKKNATFRKFVREGKYKAYAEYMTVKESSGNRSFSDWEESLKMHDAAAVKECVKKNKEEYLFWQWLQFEFVRQWKKLKRYANRKGIYIIGDVPLYVAYDSADVWSRPELFQLDGNRNMTDVAGVPPDYFCAKGQLWGNPLYDWNRQRKDGYAWWIDRLEDSLHTFDIIRMDHFRGLDRYYAVPADSETAEVGEWRDGPKKELFALAKERLGDMNIIAEDLGVLDDGVRKLLADTAYPGMKILLFAFEGGENDYLPRNIGHNSVCYTGTHDNDTALGYLKRLSPEMRKFVKSNIRVSLRERGIEHSLRGYKNTVDALIRLCLECDSCLAILPIQDILCLDNAARMNEPATDGKNWKFRLKRIPERETAVYLRSLLKQYRRK